jgi:hypothetical protein
LLKGKCSVRPYCSSPTSPSPPITPLRLLNPLSTSQTTPDRVKAFLLVGREVGHLFARTAVWVLSCSISIDTNIVDCPVCYRTARHIATKTQECHHLHQPSSIHRLTGRLLHLKTSPVIYDFHNCIDRHTPSWRHSNLSSPQRRHAQRPTTGDLDNSKSYVHHCNFQQTKNN